MDDRSVLTIKIIYKHNLLLYIYIIIGNFYTAVSL